MALGSSSCPLVHLSHPCVVELEQKEAASGARCCVDAADHTSASPLLLSLPSAKTFKRKGKFVFILPLLPFPLPLCPPPAVQ